MGMYTEVYIACEIRKDTPPIDLEVLRYMFGDRPDAPEELPNHPLFGTSRWKSFFYGDSYYFPGPPARAWKWDNIGNNYEAVGRCNIKNYEREIEKLFDWIMPFIMDPGPGEFLGFHRYEEDDRPTLMFMNN
jgi:hypothetical protein